MSDITTHVLDTVLGLPAAQIAVRLERQDGGVWSTLARSATDGDGRCRDLIAGAPEGLYRLTFVVTPYLEQLGRTSLYPEISVTFHCDGLAHYHLPLLLSDNSYTTYRGS
jgi:5-hydroxyisourate hydrolase